MVFRFPLQNLYLTTASVGKDLILHIVKKKTEDRWQTIGLVDKVIFVVFTEQGETTRIISARKADENEKRIYNGERNIESWTKAN